MKQLRVFNKQRDLLFNEKVDDVELDLSKEGFVLFKFTINNKINYFGINHSEFLCYSIF